MPTKDTEQGFEAGLDGVHGEETTAFVQSQPEPEPESESKPPRYDEEDIIKKLKESDPNNVFTIDELFNELEEKTCCSTCCCVNPCTCFCGCLQSFLCVLEPPVSDQKGNKDKLTLLDKPQSSEDEKLKLKEEIGLSFFLPDNDSESTTRRGLLTFFNVMVLLINFYILVIHSFLTEPEAIHTDQENAKKCDIRFYAPPKHLTAEIVLIPAYVTTPFLIARLMKFIFENGSFPHLLDWYKDLRHTYPTITKHITSEIKQRNTSNIFWTLLLFCAALVYSALTIFLLCVSDWYAFVQIILVVIFLCSGFYAIVASYNMLRAYTLFITARIAIFQAEIKCDIGKHDKQLEDKRLKDPDAFQNENFKLLCEIDKEMQKSKKDADEMLNIMNVVIKKIEKTVQFALGCLTVILASTFLYMFYYSIYFYEEIWPELLAAMEKMHSTEVPSPAPSIAPTTVPSIAPTFGLPGVGLGPGGSSPTGSQETVRVSFKEAIEALLGLADHEKYGVLFFVALIAVMIFVIIYSHFFALLFAKQADAWIKLREFFKCRVDNKNEANSYGPQFEKLGRSISSTKVFSWAFLVKKSHETATEALMNKLKIRLTAVTINLVVSWVFVSWPKQFGNDSEILGKVKDYLENESKNSTKL